MYTGDVPCAHGGAQEDHQYGTYGNEEGILKALEEVGLLQGILIVQYACCRFTDTLCPSVESFVKCNRGDVEWVFEDVRFLFEGVQDHDENR